MAETGRASPWPSDNFIYKSYLERNFTLKRLDYLPPDPHTIIANTIGVSLEIGRSISGDFFLDGLIPVDVDQPQILGNRDRLEFTTLIHSGLVDADIIAEFQRLDQNSLAVPISRLRLEYSVERRHGVIEERKYWARFNEEDLGNWLYIRIIHPNLGVVLQKQYHIQQLLSHVAVNPMMAALRRFCEPDDPKALVLNPEVRPKHRTNPSALFELRLTWLLSASGFQSVILGKYEKLVAPATNHEYGSVDIIATHSQTRTLFLIGCSLGPPSDQDKDRLINVTAVLKREVFKDVEQHIRPLIITGASQCGTAPNPNMPSPLFLVIDREGIERLWQAAESGNSESVVRWLET